MGFIVDDSIENYAHRKTSGESAFLESIAARTRSEMRDPQMLSGRIEGCLLKLLVQISNAALVVEVGTFTGYSALSMAEGLGERGRVITCEIDEAARDFAQAAFDASPVGHKIELRFGPAIATLRGIETPIDLSFIDADKTSYPLYYEEILGRTRPGGIIVLDNMLWSGKVLEPRDEISRVLDHLNDRISRDDRVDNVCLTVRDGIQVVRKK